MYIIIFSFFFGFPYVSYENLLLPKNQVECEEEFFANSVYSVVQYGNLGKDDWETEKKKLLALEA